MNISLSISNGHKNGANVSYSVQSKILPEIKAQILQIGYQNVQEGLGFTAKKNKFQSIIMFSSVKN